ncbi:M28 family peptidase [Bacillus sp. BGMRC 2118]|nr:M28 family peptidase [Bacillus sp. BGMRC 2118]
MNTLTQEELIREVSGEVLMNHTKHISKEVRLSGSDEELRAFHYVKTQLETYGLKTHLLFQDAYISIPLEATVTVGETTITGITHSMAPSTAKEGVKGEIIYCSDLTNNINIEGKIAILEGIALPSSVETVEKRGAIGVIFINGPYTHEMIVSTVWGNPTPGAVYPSIPVMSVNDEDGEIIKQYTECVLYTKVDTSWRKVPALTAEIRGNVEPDHFLMFSGHIDSWHYGAMDNATANATMLETARILSQQKHQLIRSVRFAFWSGHSHGRYAGSASYCDSHFEDLYNHCFLHIYVDSVGGKGATILGESNCMAETKGLASKVIQSQTNETFIGKRFSRAGDQSFWGAGIPSLYMGMSEQELTNDPASQALFKLFGGQKAGGFGWWWHTTEDTLDKIDEENLVRDCKVYVATIYEACTAPILPLDYRETIQEFIQTVDNYQELMGSSFTLRTTIERLQLLNENVNLFYHNMRKLSSTEQEIQDYNSTILKLSKILVPLGYVEGDLFDHDLAASTTPVPLLRIANNFAQTDEYTIEYYQLKTLLQRRINKVNFNLQKAIDLVQSNVY